MSFWSPIQILLRVRWNVARTRLIAQPTATLWTVLVLLLLLSTAFSMGNKLGAQWTELSDGHAEERLSRLWLEMQAFWLLALLLPGGIALLGQIPPRATLLPFGLRPVQVFLAELGAILLDAPALLACALTLPLACFLVGEGQWFECAVTLGAFTLLGLQTGVCARLLAYIAARSVRRFRRLAVMPGVTAFLLFSLCVGVPPAFASLTSPPAQHYLPARLSLPSRLPSVDIAPFLPSRVAAHSVVAARQGDYRGVLGSLGAMAGCLLLTSGAGIWALRSEGRAWIAAEVPAAAVPKVRSSRPVVRSHPGSFAQTAALIKTEFLLLLRAPQTYLPLRKPASLLLLGVFAFLAPDMSRNPVYNLEELLAIGALLYAILWQMQLLCNRFGNEAGTGALLFGFSLPRTRLLLGKNLALFGLLLLIDAPLLTGMAVVADASAQIGLFLMWLPPILLTLTSFGNLVSVLRPFSILKHEQFDGKEPPDTLAWVYPLVGGATMALLMFVAQLMSYGVPGRIAAVGTLGTLYGGSLYGANALLKRGEHAVIAALDRGNL